jgi:4-amino-4-deoxy-L-arabinose transferase-like glycosyltransferase
MKQRRQELLILGLIWLIGTVSDRLWFAFDNSVPSWDQADYLTGSLNYFHFLQSPQWLSSQWWQELWMLSPKVPPLTYLLTVPFLQIFGTGSDQTTLVYLLFSAILLYSVYGITRQLFNSRIGLWAAALCVVLPGLYVYRLQFLLDYPLTAMVTFCFYCLTMWRETFISKNHLNSQFLETRDSPQKPKYINRWFWTILLGLSLGLAILVKQTAIFFLFIPFAWIGITILRQRNWQQLLQFLLALLISFLIICPWARTNWLLMLTSGKRATLDSAMAEGDPALNTLKAWTYYWHLLPQHISWLLLIVPIVGLLLFGIPAKLKTNYKKIDAFRWLAIFLIGGYFLCSLNINKDFRYSLPLLPVFSIILAYGLLCWLKHWGKIVRWGVLILAIILMEFSLWPVGGKIGERFTTLMSPKGEYQVYLDEPLPHQQVINQIIQTEPYLQSTLGVLPSTPTINQHNLNYFGALKNYQVYGRQVGTRLKNVFQDAVSLSWFVTKTNEQGSVGRISEAQAAIVQEVEKGVQFKLHQQWQLPDESILNLYHRNLPYIEVSPITTASSKIELKQVLLPAKVPPGLPIPITYIWSGSGEQLQSGLVLLNWQLQSTDKISSRWLHDHGIAMGLLHSPSVPNHSHFQVIERMGMLPPKDATPGIYTLKATYLNRETGESYPIAVPSITVEINPKVTAIPAPELDLITQLRQLAQQLPQGITGLESIFDEIGRINQYDPTQDYTRQAERILAYRFQQEPNNLELAYSLALATVLQQDVDEAIAALKQVVQLDNNNPFAHAYLAFVYLYNWQPKAAEIALQPALTLQPNQPEFQLLKYIAQLMQGNLQAGLQLWKLGISEE